MYSSFERRVLKEACNSWLEMFGSIILEEDGMLILYALEEFNEIVKFVVPKYRFIVGDVLDSKVINL